jgi:hypothetical protein
VNIETVQRETGLVAQVSPDSESGLWHGFPIRSRRNFARSAGLEAGDTADLEICATMSWRSRRSGLALRRSGLNPRPIQSQSGLNPTQSGLIRPNPTYDKKINPRNRGTQLLKQYDQIALNRTKYDRIFLFFPAAIRFFPADLDGWKNFVPHPPR